MKSCKVLYKKKDNLPPINLPFFRASVTILMTIQMYAKDLTFANLI